MPDPLKIAERIAYIRRQAPQDHPRGFYELVLEWLNDPLPAVRREAVLYLARHLRQRSDAQGILEVLAGDTDPEVRRTAADSLGGIFRNTRHPDVAKALASVAQNPNEDPAVRGAAHAAVKRIQAR